MNVKHANPANQAGFLYFGFALVAAFLVFAPLYKGGNRPLSLLALELGALLCLAGVVWRPAFIRHASRPLLVALGLLCVLPVLQWLPVPMGIAGAAGEYARLAGVSGAARLSVIPFATEAAWLTLLPPVALFLLAVGMDAPTLKRLTYIFIGVATAQAILALIQYGGGAESMFRYEGENDANGVGTYVNRNHLAALLYMALPLVLGLLASVFGRSGSTRRYHSRRKNFVARWLAQPFKLNQTMLYTSMGIALLLGIIFSRSRSGIMLAMLALLLGAILFSRHLGGRRTVNLTTIFSVIGLALAIEIGLAPVLERFALDSALGDARWPIFEASLAGLGVFFPLGSGLGTYPDVFRRFQPDDVGRFVNHAHNDYVEFLFEGGLVAALILLLFLYAFLRRWPQLLRDPHWDTFRFIQVGAGVGLLLLSLHGITDYNWHIPGNAVYFAFLGALFFHRAHAQVAETRADAEVKARKAPDTPVRPEVGGAAAAAPVTPIASGKNPFAD